MKRLLAVLVLAAAAAMACTPSDTGSSPGVDGLESPSLTSPSLESPVTVWSRRRRQPPDRRSAHRNRTAGLRARRFVLSGGCYATSPFRNGHETRRAGIVRRIEPDGYPSPWAARTPRPRVEVRDEHRGVDRARRGCRVPGRLPRQGRRGPRSRGPRRPRDRRRRGRRFPGRSDLRNRPDPGTAGRRVGRDRGDRSGPRGHGRQHA